jgi:hypothetical protein
LGKGGIGPRLHERKTKYAENIISNILTECKIFPILGPQILKFSIQNV